MKQGSHHSLKTKAKLSRAQQGKKLSEETKAKMRRTKADPEVKARMSRAQQGKKASPETRVKLSKAHLGRKHSEESKEKMRQARLGKKHKPETIIEMKEIARRRNTNGKRNSNWRGGGRRFSGGYVMLSSPEGGRIREHHLVMEQVLDRKITGDEVVHHINGDTQDNRLENLQVMTRAEHSRHHNFDPNRKRRTSKYLGQLCLVSDCDKPVRTLGRCNAHYQRWHRQGKCFHDAQ